MRSSQPTPGAPGSRQCRIAVGADSVAALRADDPALPIVALVERSSAAGAVLAQLAGADIVLTVDGPLGHGDPSHPGLDLAVRAATAIARRRTEIAASTWRAGHDVAEALNVIGMAADAARNGRLDPSAALATIEELVGEAGADGWITGRAHRSWSRVVTAVDLGRLLLHRSFDGDDVTVVGPDHETFVFADERDLVDAIGELIENARRAGATGIRVETASAIDGCVDIVVCDDGAGFPTDVTGAIGRPFLAGCSDRLGVGLALIAEMAAELGGALSILDGGGAGDGRRTRVALSLPTIDGAAASAERRAPSVDQATVQADILERVVRHAPLTESLESIVAAIEHQLPGTICSILLLENGRSLHHGAGARLPIAYRDAIDGMAIGPARGSCGTAAYTGRPVVASDVDADHRWADFRELAAAHGLRSCWSTPIVAAGGEMLGTFAVYKRVVWRPGHDATRLVNRFTHLAAVAIEHHRLFGALAESEARFRGAFEGADAGIALVDLDGRLMKVNPALCALVGRRASSLVGTNLLDLLHGSGRNLVSRSWAGLVDGGAVRAPAGVEVRLEPSPGAPEVWTAVNTSLIDDAGGDPYLYVEVRDVTAARQQLADLRAREAAEAANRAKTDFLALASHELRTPLNAILGFAQVMQMVDLDEHDRAGGVDQIVNAGRHLRDLIDELLDLSRIESGQLSAAAEPLDGRTVLDEAIDLVRPMAAARDIEIDRSAAVSGVIVLADRRCLRQVLINLLDNGIKYTPVGGRIAATIAPSSTGSARISVADSGRGISPDSLDEVFEPFRRIDSGSGETCEGTGLGLALCARLMREMSGSIGVSSSVGSGSTFWIELPTPWVEPCPTEATAGQITAPGAPTG